MQDIINGRCGWCGTDELYVKYHDEEWGKTVTDDKTLFEFLASGNRIHKSLIINLLQIEPQRRCIQ